MTCMWCKDANLRQNWEKIDGAHCTVLVCTKWTALPPRRSILRLCKAVEHCMSGVSGFVCKVEPAPARASKVPAPHLPPPSSWCISILRIEFKRQLENDEVWIKSRKIPRSHKLFPESPLWRAGPSLFCVTNLICPFKQPCNQNDMMSVDTWHSLPPKGQNWEAQMLEGAPGGCAPSQSGGLGRVSRSVGVCQGVRCQLLPSTNFRPVALL